MIALLVLLASSIPAQYDYPYRGELRLREVPFGMAGPECRRLNPYDTALPNELLGCQFWRGTICVIVYSYRSQEERIEVLRHELAHCNGWRH